MFYNGNPIFKHKTIINKQGSKRWELFIVWPYLRTDDRNRQRSRTAHEQNPISAMAEDRSCSAQQKTCNKASDLPFKKKKSFWFTSRFHPIAIRFWDASYLNHGAYESIQWFGIILGGYFFEEESTGILSNAQIDPFNSTQFKVEKKNPKNHKQLQNPPKALPEWKKQP